jgi:hypothetical protein
LAAKEVLLQIIAGGRHGDFSIPGSNQEDARNYM